ncbi:MAG: c-type cytochrome [Proteobacteria bacterium]|nr:c-type cytochrome [Pseudomonadota bacterium]
MQDRRKVKRQDAADGIKIRNQSLPTWWMALFNFSILYALIYFTWFHILAKPGPAEQVLQDRKSQARLTAAKQQAYELLKNGDLAARLRDATAIAQGRILYQSHCTDCHGHYGEGGIGPNLSDHFWLHGAQAEQVFASLNFGIPAQGMPAWGPLLGPDKIENLAAFVLSLQGTQPLHAKGPEGDEEH